MESIPDSSILAKDSEKSPLVAGNSSDNRSSLNPDPRWPYLNRWKAPEVSKASSSPGEKSSPEILIPPLSPPSSSPPATSLVVNLPLNGSVSEKEVVCAATNPLIDCNQSKVAQSELANSGKELAEKDVAHVPIESPSLKGAWAKKLVFSGPSIAQSTRVDTEKWPSLSVSKSNRRQQARRFQVSQRSEAVEDDIRFPWAAKMNPASRNLYRATEPEYLEDGTPKVTIPQHVFLQGLENQKEYVLGQFFRCSPLPGGLIYAVFNKLWGRNCKITVRKLASLAIPEIKTILVWVTLKKIPSILYSIPEISHIALGLGAPMVTHKPRLDPINMGEAKILVEVELSKGFPPRIAADDKKGFISMVDVDYAWLPSKCGQSIDLSPSNIPVNDGNESNFVEPTSTITMDDLISLGTISILENMSACRVHHYAPTTINIAESIETPSVESAQV
ncbi:unnamed protein product [Microthlaspi erraticum]|uniref:DUF4283 domain-containing protein n=1 Tax=Microthlaspi erraticum TaxID=1685480 RepID=A0A6D2HMS7_9BRAS|nr:unnamed protein product [Microthlaspi erraticum]CAA7045379.1 unnamed protein product [Microthlaspi erraticum]